VSVHSYCAGCFLQLQQPVLLCQCMPSCLSVCTCGRTLRSCVANSDGACVSALLLLQS
jgi:hypothetical protein